MFTFYVRTYHCFTCFLSPGLRELRPTKSVFALDPEASLYLAMTGTGHSAIKSVNVRSFLGNDFVKSGINLPTFQRIVLPNILDS